MDLGDQIRQPAYATLGLRAEWTDPSDRLTLAVYGDNVTDKRYYFSGQTSSASYPIVWAAPAMVFGEIKYRFH
jgi:iron complex outermembrane receptor protein